MAPRTRRALFIVTLFLATCAVLGTFINQKVAAQSASDESTLRDSLHSFTNVYAMVEQNYAEHLDSDKVDKAIYDGAIPGMLHTLDPHSNFYDPKAFAQMREDQHGKYYGVGMSIQPQPDATAKNGLKIVVLTPFEGTPAYKAGIRPGDVIKKVDDKSTDGMDSLAVANLLKGPRGTHVSVTMDREGSAKPLVFDLIRDEVSRPSVDLAFMIRPGIGYMHVTNFMETTSREVGDALDKFGNINTTVIGDYAHPKTRLPGGGGAPEIATSSRQVYITMAQSKRGMVEKIDFFTSFGHGDGGDHRKRLGIDTAGPTLLITDLAIWKPDPVTKEFTVVSLHPGVSREQVQETCGWTVKFAEALDETPAPTELELKTLRDLQARTKAAHQGTAKGKAA